MMLIHKKNKYNLWTWSPSHVVTVVVRISLLFAVLWARKVQTASLTGTGSWKLVLNNNDRRY